MGRDHTGARKGFYHLARSWYATYQRPRDLVDSVTFGWYCEEGGTSGEMEMLWKRLSGDIVPRLIVYDDAFHALSTFTDVVGALAEYDECAISPEAFCALLLGLGFTDLTQTTDPYHPSTQEE